MKTKLFSFAALCLLLLGGLNARAQELPRKVENVKVFDLENNPVTLPEWGKKNLLIFYIDPDKHKQNEEFTYDMELNHRAEGANLYGFGIINLKDSGFPNFIVRGMARKRTAKNGATVLADKERALSEAWGLGSCDDKFVLLLVSREGELVFMRKGELTEADKAEFYRVVEAYR